MYDVDEVVERLARLSYEEALAYWISGERKEAELYSELAKRAKDLGLGGERLVETFEQLAKDSLKHAKELNARFEREYGRKPPSEIESLEVLPVLNEFERADQLEEVLKAAMESELIAHESYKALSERVEDPELRELYRKLADVELKHYEALLERYEELMREKVAP